MAGIRNGPLVQALVQSTDPPTVGTVPTGLTWLVKTIHLLNPSASTVHARVELLSANGLMRARVLEEDLAVAGAFTWEGWTALAAGDHVELFLDTGGLYIWLSGAELPGERQGTVTVLPAG